MLTLVTKESHIPAMPIRFLSSHFCSVKKDMDNEIESALSHTKYSSSILTYNSSILKETYYANFQVHYFILGGCIPLLCLKSSALTPVSLRSASRMLSLL